jgi:opacity protein-like surface antigen
MKKACLLPFFILIYSFSSFSQVEKHSSQVGISGLPVFDVLKMFPDNDISGFAILGNFGYFPAKDLALGVNPYYASVHNEYAYRYYSILSRKREEISAYGMNIYARYYFLSQKRFSLYPSLAAGFGNLVIKDFIDNTRIENRNAAAVSFTAGLGLSCSLNEMISVELNVPYLYLKSLTNENIEFRTVAPTLGIQLFFK